jgi:hypothetical protein
MWARIEKLGGDNASDWSGGNHKDILTAVVILYIPNIGFALQPCPFD